MLSVFKGYFEIKFMQKEDVNGQKFILYSEIVTNIHKLEFQT